jgi:hypothetical protein
MQMAATILADSPQGQVLTPCEPTVPATQTATAPAPASIPAVTKHIPAIADSSSLPPAAQPPPASAVRAIPSAPTYNAPQSFTLSVFQAAPQSIEQQGPPSNDLHQQSHLFNIDNPPQLFPPSAFHSALQSTEPQGPPLNNLHQHSHLISAEADWQTQAFNPHVFGLSFPQGLFDLPLDIIAQLQQTGPTHMTNSKPSFGVTHPNAMMADNASTYASTLNNSFIGTLPTYE